MLTKDTIYRVADSIRESLKEKITINNTIKLNDPTVYKNIVNQLSENSLIISTLELIDSNIEILKSIDNETVAFDLHAYLKHIYVESDDTKSYNFGYGCDDINEKSIVIKVLKSLYETLYTLISDEKVLMSINKCYAFNGYIIAQLEVMNVEGIDLDKVIAAITEKTIVKYNIV